MHGDCDANVLPPHASLTRDLCHRCFDHPIRMLASRRASVARLGSIDEESVELRIFVLVEMALQVGIRHDAIVGLAIVEAT